MIHHLLQLISRRPQQKEKAMPFSGFYPVLGATELLEPHRELVDKIRQYFGVPESVWASTHAQLLHNFSRRVQLLPAGGSYRPEFCREQQDQHHQSIPLLIAGQIIPKTALQWLSRYPDVFNLWLLTLSGRYAEAGMLGEIITRADQYATPKPLSQNIGDQQLHAEAKSESPPTVPSVATSRRAKEKQAGQAFLQWLRQQIVDDNIGINTDNAQLHTVEEGLLIVSPALFRRYLRHVDHLELAELQKGFQSLGIHRMMAPNQPIWTFQQQGKKRISKLRGMLISDPLTVLDLDDLPEANPLLTAETSKTENVFCPPA